MPKSKRAKPAKNKYAIPGLETIEDRNGFGMVAGPEWQFSQIIAQLYSGTSVQGVRVGLELLSKCIGVDYHLILTQGFHPILTRVTGAQYT